MRSSAWLLALVLLAGCTHPGEQKPEPKTDNAAVLSAVLNRYANSLERDGLKEKPRIKTASHVTSSLMYVFDEAWPDGDLTGPEWRREWNAVMAKYEPDGTQKQLTAEQRAEIVAMIREKASK